MKNFKMLLGTLGLGALLLVGCGENEVVKATNEFADAVCKCKDTKCIEEVTGKHLEKLAKMKDAKGTESDMKKIEAAGKKMEECRKKIMEASVK